MTPLRIKLAGVIGTILNRAAASTVEISFGPQ